MRYPWSNDSGAAGGPPPVARAGIAGAGSGCMRAGKDKKPITRGVVLLTQESRNCQIFQTGPAHCGFRPLSLPTELFRVRLTRPERRLLPGRLSLSGQPERPHLAGMGPPRLPAASKAGNAFKKAPRRFTGAALFLGVNYSSGVTSPTYWRCPPLISIMPMAISAS